MKNNKILVLLLSLSLSIGASASDLYKIKVPAIDGISVPMSQYKGKVLVVVNTASQCGYTPQLRGLESLYKKYKSQGLEILAFPSNDFKQDPSSNIEIMSYAQKNFQVSFPFFEKNSVAGEKKQPIYKYLSENQKATLFKDVAWNFEKFLIGRNGEVIERFPSNIAPESQQMIQAIEKALARK
jgi:glutathione peroxidase